jgi:hypothetical protein
MLVRAGIVKILERVATARERAREETWARVAPLLTLRRQAELDEMLAVDPVLGRTRLSWLGTGPVAATPAAVKGELEKLAYLRGLDADTLDLSVLPAERRRFLAGVGRRLTAQNLARRDDDRRYPILLTLVAESAVDVLDEVLLLFDQALSGSSSRMCWPPSGSPAAPARTTCSRLSPSWPGCTRLGPARSPTARPAGSCPPAGPATSRRPRRTATSPPTGTTGGCAC